MKNKSLLFIAVMIFGVVSIAAQSSSVPNKGSLSRASWVKLLAGHTVGPKSGIVEETIQGEQQRPPDGVDDVIKPDKQPTLVGSWLLTVKVPDNAPPFDSFKALW